MFALAAFSAFMQQPDLVGNDEYYFKNEKGKESTCSAVLLCPFMPAIVLMHGPFCTERKTFKT